MRSLPYFAGLPLAFFVLSCTAESASDSGEEALGTTAEAFTGFAFADVTGSGDANTSTTTVSSSSQAFLSGVWGNFAYTPNSTQVSPNVTAAVGDYGDGTGPFILGVSPAFTNPPTFTNTVRATAWATYPGNNATAPNHCSHSGSGSNSVPLAIPSGPPAHWGCWITRVKNTTGSSWGAWADQAIVTYVGSPPSPVLNCLGNSEAWAQCTPYTAYIGGASAGSTSGSTSTPLGGTDWTNGKLCLLRGINGSFRDNTSGVSASVIGTNWNLTTSANHGAYVDCIR